jgi:hypothetical protein
MNEIPNIELESSPVARVSVPTHRSSSPAHLPESGVSFFLIILFYLIVSSKLIMMALYIRHMIM